jgi:hypothetical protein
MPVAADPSCPTRTSPFGHYALVTEPRKRWPTALAARFVGRLGVVLAGGALLGRVTGGGSTEAILVLVPLGVGLFVLGLRLDREG